MGQRIESPGIYIYRMTEILQSYCSMHTVPGQQLSSVLPGDAHVCVLGVQSIGTHSSLASFFRFCSSAGMGSGRV